jgi:hypothetical protein
MIAMSTLIQALSRVARLDTQARGLDSLLLRPHLRLLGLTGASACEVSVGSPPVVANSHTVFDVLAWLLVGVGLTASYATPLPLLNSRPSLEVCP